MAGMPIHSFGSGLLPTETPFPPRLMTSLMRRTLFLAEKNLGATAPNPSVGTVIVHPGNGEIIASAVTARGGRPHAEVQALRDAGEGARGAILFTTLEPCSHFGATPPCSHSIVDAGVSAVVYGSLDPDPRVAGRGLAWLERHGVRTQCGDFIKEADWINLGHALRVTERRPFVQLKVAVDANGRVPRGQGAPVFVSGPEARDYSHLLRAQADAILVGRKTVEADDPFLTCRLPGLEDRSPIRVVLAPKCNVAPKARLFEAAKPPVWIVCGDSSACPAYPQQSVRIFDIGASPEGELNLRLALMRLAAEGVTRLLVEGGPATSKAFFDAGLADEIVIIQSGKVLNADASLPALGGGFIDLASCSHSYMLVESRSLGEDRMRVLRASAHWKN